MGVNVEGGPPNNTLIFVITANLYDVLAGIISVNAEKRLLDIVGHVGVVMVTDCSSVHAGLLELMTPVPPVRLLALYQSSALVHDVEYGEYPTAVNNIGEALVLLIVNVIPDPVDGQ